jgi:Mn-dependent DtxR family transcriptional regulator
LDIAAGIAGKHRIIKRFFSEILETNPETADKDACAIEHVISGAAVDAMEKFLTN